MVQEGNFLEGYFKEQVLALKEELKI